MNEVFVIRNQSGHYWGKSKAWVDGSDPRGVLRVKHHDEGINTLFELSSKDVGLRGEVMAVTLGEKGEPLLEVSDNPLPATDEEAAAETTTAADEQPARATETA